MRLRKSLLTFSLLTELFMLSKSLLRQDVTHKRTAPTRVCSSLFSSAWGFRDPMSHSSSLKNSTICMRPTTRKTLITGALLPPATQIPFRRRHVLCHPSLLLPLHEVTCRARTERDSKGALVAPTIAEDQKTRSAQCRSLTKASIDFME